MVSISQMRHMLITLADVKLTAVLLSFLILSSACLAGNNFDAGNQCAGIDQRLPGKALSSAIIHVLNREMSKKVNEGQAVIEKIEKYSGKNNWHIVWTTPTNMERGVFILSGNSGDIEYKGVWGGCALPEEEQSVLEWFKSQAPDAPLSLLECTAYALTHEQP